MQTRQKAPSGRPMQLSFNRAHQNVKTGLKSRLTSRKFCIRFRQDRSPRRGLLRFGFGLRPGAETAPGFFRSPLCGENFGTFAFGTSAFGKFAFAKFLAAFLFLICANSDCGLIVSNVVFAQDASSNSEIPADGESLKKLIERLNKLEGEVDRLRKGEATAVPQVVSMLDTVHLGLFYSGSSQTRYLAIHVMLANPTKQAFTITRDQVLATIDGEDRKLRELPMQLLNYSIPYGKQHVQISTMKPPKEWKLAAGGQAGLWLVYHDLPLGPNVPKCRLKIRLGDSTNEIDVNELQRAQLNLDVQRIGPRKCLALLTVGGSMNFFNAGAFVDELDKLVDQKVARVVVRWGDGATPPDQQLMQWLQVAAVGNAGNPNTNQLFPVIPAAIREFHLTEIANSEETQVRAGNAYGLKPTTQPRIHKTSAESVGAALRTAYLALPRDELIEEIRTGNPLTRAAALAYGGGRLSTEHLPQIFQWAEDQDPEIQKAALQALSHFGEPEAIAKLVDFAKRNIEPLSSSAIESLAGSRFGSAHEALLGLLNNEPAASKKKIVQVLAKYPRPIWSETLFQFVTDSQNGMDVDSLKALVQVGHPRLVEVLETALKSSDRMIREEAFKELSKRSDERSESLSVEYALKLLDAGPPDMNVVQLLSRTKEQRAIPLLLKQLEVNNSNSDQVNTINLLLQLGDQDVADKLVQRYGALKNNEKVQILQGLKLFRHSKFRELCGEALTTNDNQLVTAAATALWQDGHTEGERLLIEALDKQKTAHLLVNIMQALANFGSPAARAALVKARDSGDLNKKASASQALLMMRQRSPGYQYIFQAINHRQNNQDKEAFDAYSMSLQLDPALPEAYLGRGQLLLKQEKFGEARKDFEKVVELKHDFVNGEFGEFVTSLAIARIGEGQLTEGLNFLEENRVKCLENSRELQRKALKGLFHYNAACAYSRAVEQVDKQTELEGRETLRERYRKQAITDLTESFKQGFDDYDWTSKDPDFKVLHEDAAFKNILASKPNEKPEDKRAGEDE